jgi:excisionase family DNA binding protein
MMTDKKSYRIDEVAREFDVSPRTVERWIKSGELDAVRIGHTRRVMSDTLTDIKKKSDNYRQLPTK